ncbi:hypothetical protein [Actinoplanes sp. GCM10030250]|uniref:hypothetical protein n=1 Tax=Actinoplanes sp. GCM10030250 TaxID=3273376 RepID=UPI00360F8123
MRRTALLTMAFAVIVGPPISPAAAAAPAPPASARAAALPSLQVASALASTRVGQQGETFHRSPEFAVWRSGVTNSFLSGFRDANGPFVVDDLLIMTITGSKGQRKSVKIDFGNKCTLPAPRPRTFLDVNKWLYSGLNTVSFALRDQCGDIKGNSNIFLSGAGVIDPASVRSTGCSPGKFAGGIIGSPAYVASTHEPKVNGQRRIEGSAAVSVVSRINCSATVQFVLETKVCNRFGHLCKARTIARTDKERLPSSGVRNQTLTGACRKGVDSYRMRVRVDWAQVVGLNDKAAFLELDHHSENEPDGDRGWVKLSC